MIEVRSGHAPVCGASLYYETVMPGRAGGEADRFRDVVLLHAGIADCRMWDGLFEALGARVHAIRFDIRGFGRSPMPSGRFSYHDDVLGLLDHLGVDRADLIGCSFGGQIALDCALAHPRRVRSLLLVGAGVGGRDPSETMERFGEEEERLLGEGDFDAATELNLRLWVDGPRRAPEEVDPIVRERVRALQRAQFELPVPDGVVRTKLEPPAIARLAEIRVPTLALAGELDQPDVLETAVLLEKGIPGCRRVVLPRTAHLPSMEVPTRFEEIAIRFLEEPSPEE